jgi:hypothetical protein
MSFKHLVLQNVTNKEQMFIFISARSRRQRRVRFGSKDVFKHEALSRAP